MGRVEDAEAYTRLHKLSGNHETHRRSPRGGLPVGDKGPLLIRNNFVGNRANGVDLFPGPAGVITRLRENNIFGNGNCGTTNQSNIGGSVGATLDARNNYWGAATGPSFNDPADPACQGLHPTLSEPFASSEFEVR